MAEELHILCLHCNGTTFCDCVTCKAKYPKEIQERFNTYSKPFCSICGGGGLVKVHGLLVKGLQICWAEGGVERWEYDAKYELLKGLHKLIGALGGANVNVNEDPYQSDYRIEIAFEGTSLDKLQVLAFLRSQGFKNVG